MYEHGSQLLAIRPTVQTRIKLHPELIQSNKILTMGIMDLTSYLNQAALDNPALIVNPPSWQLNGWAHRPNPLVEKEPDDSPDPIAALPAAEPSLTEELKSTLRLQKVEPPLLNDAFIIIDALDENGFLADGLEDLARHFSLPISRLEKALQLVQSLDPPGIGARDLRECLHLQHRRLGIPSPVLTAIIDGHLEDVAKGQLQVIARTLRVPLDTVLDAIALLKTFNPKPGNGYPSSPTVFIIPDAEIRIEAGALQIWMNDHLLPRLSVDPKLEQMLNDPAVDDQTLCYIKEKLDQAKKLIGYVKARMTTVQRVIECAVNQQRDFFLYGSDHLKPLTMQSVAADLQLSVSTISRAVRDKYIESPRGLLPLKALFPSSIGDHSPGTTPLMIIKLIQEYIQREDKTNPLSDADLAAALQAQGIQVSRRTVAKYRGMAQIPSSHQRRQYHLARVGIDRTG